LLYDRRPLHLPTAPRRAGSRRKTPPR
jgi:hypothetical protein